MLMNLINKYIRYFKNPLSGIAGLSSHGLPNSLVHLPVILMVSFLGIFICGSEAKSLLPVYFIVALYGGRDLVSFSYKNYLIPLCLWAVFLLFLIYKTEISAFLAMQSLQFSVAFSIAVLIGFTCYVTVWIKYFLK